MNIEQALRRVPDFERFYTVNEMFSHAKTVADQHPELVSYQVVGASTDGEEIPMVRIGRGDTHVLLFACPHPNEPIGAMLVQFLLGELVADETLRTGRSWFLLPCVDPDGTRLNEGWFAGPFTIRNYAENFYRPRSEEQVEWTFPIDYKSLSFQQPIPETQALMKAFELAKPQLVYSLHNAGFGGVYYYLSHDFQDVYEDFYQIPSRRELVLSLGEPEMPWAIEYAPAVYQMPSIKDSYDYYEAYSTHSPASLIQGGGSSFDYLRERGNPAMLITELPYFQSPQLADETPTSKSRRDVILTGITQTREMIQALDGILERIQPEMTLDTRFYRTVCSFTQQILEGLESKQGWAEKADGMSVSATVAQETDELYVGTFYRLLIASMLRRALDKQLAVTPKPALSKARDDLEQLLERWTAWIEDNLDYSSIPIKKLVEVQYGALLAVLDSNDFKREAAI